jgi:superfamily I DNA/RNA helicase
VSREHRVFGAPGTGKTTFLAKQIGEAVRQFGPQAVMVCSFTKAAAQELVSRGLPIPRDRVGTLHSFCHRALDQPEVAEKSKKRREWNDRVSPEYFVEHKAKDDDPWVRSGESIFLLYSALRNRQVERSEWKSEVRRFAELWEEWKTSAEVVDFTDLIETVVDRGIPCPYDNAVLFADEVQDYSALELSVVRSWGEEARHFVLAGDDQQCIYGFRGATPDAFLSPEIPAKNKTMLGKSYRLPSVIRDYAHAWGTQLERYEPKEFEPREEGGEVLQDNITIQSPKIVPIVETEIAAGRSVMILATCEFLLRSTVGFLRDAGIRFHNPYQPDNPRWNPLRGIEKIRLFLDSKQWRDVWPWFETLDAERSGLRRGAKKLVKATSTDEKEGKLLVTDEDFRMLAGIAVPPKDPEWLVANCLASKAKQFDYPLAVIRKHGLDSLDTAPSVIVGTIHSVKGGEADTVIVFPDISSAALREVTSSREGVDSMTRLFYVAMTRARKKLVLGRATSSRFINLVPKDYKVRA